MLVELAIGDAYGAGFEYAPALFVKAHNDLSHYLQHPHYKMVTSAPKPFKLSRRWALNPILRLVENATV